MGGMHTNINISIAVLILLMLGACRTLPSPAERFSRAKISAAEHGWQPDVVEGADFDLMTFSPANIQTPNLTIYIEGDGFAWLSSDVPSQNPTPINFLALQLALAQPEGTAVYLARPCQYVSGGHAHHCSIAAWTNARFSPQVIGATNHAIDVIKQRSQAKRIVLIGYSGGGAVAALVAAHRNDVARLITVAGNLDTTTWVSLHNVTPLTQSLNPLDEAEQLKALPQLHLVGGKDNVVPVSVVENYINRLDSRYVSMRKFENFDHICCWVDAWPQLWPQINQ